MFASRAWRHPTCQVCRLRAAMMRFQGPEGSGIEGLVSWQKTFGNWDCWMILFTLGHINIVLYGSIWYFSWVFYLCSPILLRLALLRRGEEPRPTGFGESGRFDLRGPRSSRCVAWRSPMWAAGSVDGSPEVYEGAGKFLLRCFLVADGMSGRLTKGVMKSYIL